MKVLYVLPYSDEESSFIFAKRQIRAISECGVETKIHYIKSRLSINGILKEIKLIKQVANEFKPDIVHAQYGTVVAFIATRVKNVPFVVTFQGSDLNPTKDISWIREKLGKYLSKIAAKRATKIICVSERLWSNLRAGKSKATIIPSGIDISVFKTMNKIECKMKLNLDLTKHFIFFNANNPVVKRLDIAQEACRILKDLNVELLSLSGNTAPDDIPYYLNASAVLLLCSDSEGSPMVIKEAMACDLPIVSVNVGDVAERIEEVENCFIVEQNADLIADKIRWIIEQKLEHSNGRQVLQNQGLDSSTVVKKILEIYHSILDKK